MKQTLSVLALVFAFFAVPAHAQWAVIDPVNLVENMLTAANTLRQVENQVRQLENETTMLENEAKNLKGLNFNSMGRLRSTLATTERLMAETRGLSLTLNRLADQYAALYPVTYDQTIARTQLTADSRTRWINSREALNTTLEVQAQSNANFGDDEAVLSDLVARSQSAEGALQASQATNQLLALQSRQLIQSQQLDIVQNRAVALEQARAVAAEERSRELRRRFMRPETSYTPESIDAAHD
jgi:P-type conjugative transfer protein TrbJ